MPVRLWALILAGLLFSPSSRAQDGMQWSEASGALRLGVGTDDKGGLRIVLENVESERLQVLVGMKSAAGGETAFHFHATAPDGASQEMFYMPGAGGAAGLLTPETITLGAGEKREFVFPLRKILWFTQGKNKDLTLAALLERHYKLTVTLEVREQDVTGMLPPKQSRLWIGLVTCHYPG